VNQHSHQCNPSSILCYQHDADTDMESLINCKSYLQVAKRKANELEALQPNRDGAGEADSKRQCTELEVNQLHHFMSNKCIQAKYIYRRAIHCCVNIWTVPRLCQRVKTKKGWKRYEKKFGIPNIPSFVRCYFLSKLPFRQ